MKINYNGKRFRPVQNTENSETSEDTVFEYRQTGSILTSAYAGGSIQQGHLLGKVDDAGNITLRYHQINQQGELMAGFCQSRPEIQPNGKIRLHETWQWTTGDCSKGTSILQEE